MSLRIIPALKGSLIIEIRASPSVKEPEVSAIVVDIFALQGPYIEQGVGLGFLPILIESEADFSAGAQAVIDLWTQVGDIMTKLNQQKSAGKNIEPR